MPVTLSKAQELPWSSMPTAWQMAVADSWDAYDGPALPLQEWTELNLRDAQIYDLSPLAYFINLLELDLSDTPVRQFTPVSRLEKLRRFEALGCQLSDLDFLSDLKRLEVLDISYPITGPKDMSAITRLPYLKEVYVNHCGVKDIRALAELPDLQILSVLFNPIPKEEIAWFQKQRPDCQLIC